MGCVVCPPSIVYVPCQNKYQPNVFHFLFYSAVYNAIKYINKDVWKGSGEWGLEGLVEGDTIAYMCDLVNFVICLSH